MRINLNLENNYKPSFQRAILSKDNVTKATLSSMFDKCDIADKQINAFMTELDVATKNKDAVVSITEGSFPEWPSDVYIFNVHTESGKKSIEVQKEDVGTNNFISQLNDLTKSVKNMFAANKPSKAQRQVKSLYQHWGTRQVRNDEYTNMKNTQPTHLFGDKKK